MEGEMKLSMVVRNMIEYPSVGINKEGMQMGRCDNLSTVSRKTTIELNLALLKITHEVTQRKENDNEV